jgi:hypothetical protein
MNERIYELYRQAHLVREYPADDPMRGGNPPTVYWGGDESAKKFAQLIVQECAEVCYDHSRAAGGVDTDFGYGYKDCGDDIKRNFGVKE